MMGTLRPSGWFPDGLWWCTRFHARRVTRAVFGTRTYSRKRQFLSAPSPTVLLLSENCPRAVQHCYPSTWGKVQGLGKNHEPTVRRLSLIVSRNAACGSRGATNARWWRAARVPYNLQMLNWRSRGAKSGQ